MKNILFGTFLFTLVSFTLNASDSSAQLQEHQTYEGDINLDGHSDKVILLSECGDCFSWEKESKPKLVLEVQIFDPKTKKYTLLTKSESIICFACGGAKGLKVVGDVQINKKGLLIITYSGGSRWSWDNTFKWRLNKDKNSFDLIGSTFNGYDTAQDEGDAFSPDSVGNTIKSDINYLNKKIIKKVVSKDLKLKTLNCSLPSTFNQPTFEKFDFENFEDGSNSCRK